MQKLFSHHSAKVLLKAQPLAEPTFTKLISYNSYVRKAGTVASFLLVLIGILTVFPFAPKSSNGAEAISAPLESESTIAMVVDHSSANLSVAPISTDGTFASSTEADLASFNVTTNNYTGYTLSILASDDDGQLFNDEADDYLTSIDHTISETTFDNNIYNGKWGYMPSKYYSTENVSFRPAPTTDADTLDETSKANNEANNYTIGLGARVDYSKPTGAYSNTFTLALVANNTPYTLSFTDTTGDDVSNMPSAISGSSSSTSVALPKNVPTRTGYTFAGWCDVVPTAGTGDNYGSTVCINSEGVSGNVYNPSTETTTNYYNFIDQTASSNISTLYTIWTINKYNLTINFAGSGVASVKVCIVSGDCSEDNLIGTVSTNGGKVSGLTYNESYYLYPTFNNNYEFSSWANSGSYGTLSCVATSSCSSDSNPSFTIGVGDGIVTITGKSTMLAIQDITDSTCTTVAQQVYDNRDNQIYLIQKLADGKCWMLDNLRLGVTDIATDLTSTNTNLSTTITASTWNGYRKTSEFDGWLYTDSMFNSSSANTTTTSYGAGSGKIGVYYNYCAASAGTYCMASGSGSGNASYDVCPSGWRMPTGGSSGEYQALYTAYSSDATNFRVALSTPLSGYFDYNSAYNQGSYGVFWSSTYLDDNRMYRLSVSSSDVNPTDYRHRSYGYSVRCVLKGPLEVSSMQNMTSVIASAAPDGATATLVDSRDQQEYTVAKINGNVWMTRNLAIGCAGTGSTYSASVSSKTLTISTSNVPSNYTTPTSSGHSNTYTEGKIVCDATYGAWYNYYAASAGTISGDNNDTEDTYNICPKGWTMPTYAQAQTIGNGSSTYVSAFSPVRGGIYYNGSLYSTYYGYWWSRTVNSTNRRYNLDYDGPNLYTNSIDRQYGYYVRCVASS